MLGKVWDEITYPFLNFNGCTVEVKEWISNLILHIIKDVLTYVSKRGHWWLVPLINAPTRTGAACPVIKRVTGKFIVLSRIGGDWWHGIETRHTEMTPAQRYDQRIRTDNHKSPAKVRSYLLWLIVAKWRHMATQLLSKLSQIMACCLTAPSHYLNQSGHIIKGVLWHAPENRIKVNHW